MDNLKYNVSEILKNAFGIKSPIYFPDTEEKEKNVLSLEGVEVLPDYYESEGTSWMGTPIVFSAVFKGGIYKQYNELGKIVNTNLNDFQLPTATIFSFRRAKNISRTNILGSNGTVKEIFGHDDWIIDVKGVALDEPNKTAMEQINELLNWERLADSINISGKLFNQHKIDKVCISDFSSDILQGQGGATSFQFQLYSDTEITYI
jgi:hypothetical protein